MFLFFLFVGPGGVSLAQTYIQGIAVRPFSEIANSTLLKPEHRLDMNAAYGRLIQLDPKPIAKKVDDMVGEFWWIDGMLVEVTARNITATYPKDNLDHVRYAYRPSVNAIVGGPEPDRTLQNDYFDEVKSVNNYEVLVHYFRTRSKIKTFRIQDNQGRYKVFGTVYTSDHQKAHALIDTLLNSITFK